MHLTAIFLIAEITGGYNLIIPPYDRISAQPIRRSFNFKPCRWREESDPAPQFDHMKHAISYSSAV